MNIPDCNFSVYSVNISLYFLSFFPTSLPPPPNPSPLKKKKNYIMMIDCYRKKDSINQIYQKPIRVETCNAHARRLNIHFAKNHIWKHEEFVRECFIPK